MGVLSIPLLITTIHTIRERGDQTKDSDAQTTQTDGTAGKTGIRMPAVMRLDRVSMITVISRDRIGLVGNGQRGGRRLPHFP